MTLSEKENFINELMDVFKSAILSKVEKMPDEWEGMEIRWYIKDKIDEFTPKHVGTPKRKRDYQNTIITTNL